jgi:hypothetical protein
MTDEMVAALKTQKRRRITAFFNYRLYIMSVLTLLLTTQIHAQQLSEETINLLLKKQVISQQEADSLKGDLVKKQKNEVFTIDLEIRPRTELRNGFRQLRADTSRAAFLTSQRSRLSLAYKREKFLAVFSIQDIRTWGAADPRFTGGTVQLFEAYVEPYLTNNFSIRVGKQRLMYDNQRLFAQNDWRQNAGTHDALNFRYYKNKFEAELAFAFNQSSEPLFFTPYTPVGFNYYKTLGVNYLKYKTPNDKWAFTTINYFEGFQVLGAKNTEKISFRYTDGGRIEYIGKIYATISAYIQHGKNQSGKAVYAFYIQPEVRYNLKKTEIRLGAEIKSGNDPSGDANYKKTDHAFQYPYGVAHRFNGTMEYFASAYPGSSKDVGLINPYLFLEQKIKEKIAISLQNHIFLSQFGSLNAKSESVDKYLGFESDFLFVYRPNNYTKLDFGFSTLIGTESLEYIAGGNHNRTPFWSYVQLTLTPKLLSIKK